MKGDRIDAKLKGNKKVGKRKQWKKQEKLIPWFSLCVISVLGHFTTTTCAFS